ncbi:hypothetical protein EVA_10458 [gut metagenome]|uniref:Uncharacterized protein n=1 Tax=gut metagenome TaxID=749906 RepID=J9CMU0_9ZZZZ
MNKRTGTKSGQHAGDNKDDHNAGGNQADGGGKSTRNTGRDIPCIGSHVDS